MFGIFGIFGRKEQQHHQQQQQQLSMSLSQTPPSPPPSSSSAKHLTSSSLSCVLDEIADEPQQHHQQQQQQLTRKPSIKHFPSIHPAEMTTNNYNNNYKEDNNNTTTTTTSKDHVVGGSDGGGGFFVSLSAFVQTVKQFVVSLVFAAVSQKQQPLALTNGTVDSEYRHTNSADVDKKSSTLQAEFHSNCVTIDSLAGLSTAGSLIAACNRKPQLHQSGLEQPDSLLLHSSLLDLITNPSMEAPPNCAATTVGEQMAHGDIGRAVDFYLATLSAVPVAVAVPVTVATISAAAGNRNEARLAQKKQQKRKHYLNRQATKPAKSGGTNGNITWPNSDGVAQGAATTTAATMMAPPTTMHTLAKTLNVRPLHKTSNKNRREKERHKLSRHIHDVLTNADQQIGDEDDHADDAAANAAVDGTDMVDFCLVRTDLLSLSPAMGLCIAVPETKSFTCFTHDDFPEMRSKSSPAKTTKTTTKCGAVAIAESVCATVVAIATAAAVVVTPLPPSAPAILPTSLSWEIPVDELRVPAKRPSGRSLFDTPIVTVTIAAATAAVAGSSSSQSPSSSATITSQYQQLLLAGLMPRRERQISECSDDFICFERSGDEDDDDDDEDDICYDMADDSTDESSDDSDDDAEEEAETEEDSDSDDEGEAAVSDAAGNQKKNLRKTPDPADVDDEESESDTDTESETCSATHQLDSGFEENKGNRVRFAAAPRVHIIRTWCFAYRQARKSYWEQMGRDRVRFADRIRRVQDTIGAVLGAEHRERVLQRMQRGQEEISASM